MSDSKLFTNNIFSGLQDKINTAFQNLPAKLSADLDLSDRLKVIETAETSEADNGHSERETE